MKVSYIKRYSCRYYPKQQTHGYTASEMNMMTVIAINIKTVITQRTAKYADTLKLNFRLVTGFVLNAILFTGKC
jgi:hypothetical protein